MKNFDQEWQTRKSAEVRTFQLCGVQFVMREAIRPEAFAGVDDPSEDAPIDETMAKVDARFLSMIEPEDGASETRYRELRARDDGGLSIRDITEVINWIIEEQTGRPPTSPTASSPGRQRTGTR